MISCGFNQISVATLAQAHPYRLRSVLFFAAAAFLAAIMQEPVKVITHGCYDPHHTWTLPVNMQEPLHVVPSICYGYKVFLTKETLTVIQSKLACVLVALVSRTLQGWRVAVAMDAVAEAIAGLAGDIDENDLYQSALNCLKTVYNSILATDPDSDSETNQGFSQPCKVVLRDAMVSMAVRIAGHNRDMILAILDYADKKDAMLNSYYKCFHHLPEAFESTSSTRPNRRTKVRRRRNQRLLAQQFLRLVYKNVAKLS